MIISTPSTRTEPSNITHFRGSSVHSNPEFVLTRATTAGRFSLIERGPVAIDAEPGLIIRVHAGCLWVPHHEEYCSVGVGAGEQFVVRQAGRLTTMATDSTQLELEWPSHGDPAAHGYH